MVDSVTTQSTDGLLMKIQIEQTKSIYLEAIDPFETDGESRIGG